MPFALTLIGLVMIVTGVRDTHAALGRQLASDGPAFLWFAAAIAAVGSLGYIEQLRTFSSWFMALIILAMFLSNKGFFPKLQDAIKAGPSPAPTSGLGSLPSLGFFNPGAGVQKTEQLPKSPVTGNPPFNLNTGAPSWMQRLFGGSP